MIGSCYGQVSTTQFVISGYVQTAHTATKCPSGGYILSAASQGNALNDRDCDSFGFTDAWIVRVDDNFNILWQKCLGSADADGTTKVLELPDSNFIVLGVITNDTISGNCTVTTNGQTDIWLTKLDPNGNVIWQNNFGGLDTEGAGDIIALNDGTMIVAGTSASNIGFDKSQNCFGYYDCWVFAVDANGNKLWDKTFGGTGKDSGGDLYYDEVNGYIYVNALSDSDVSGNKTENSYGEWDSWILKLNLNGTLIDQLTLGGNLDEAGESSFFMYDNDIILAGTSHSGISGNKTTGCNGQADLWIVKLNSALSIEWQKSYGGIDYEAIRGGYVIKPSEIILQSYSDSGISGDKTEISRGLVDNWIISIDPLNGDLLWQKTIGGNKNDTGVGIYATTDSTYTLIAASSSPISGDKTVEFEGYSGNDFWVFGLFGEPNQPGLPEEPGPEPDPDCQIRVYPNPSISKLTTEGCYEKYTIYDVTGRIIKSGLADNEVDVSDLAKGNYFLLCHLIDSVEIYRFEKM